MSQALQKLVDNAREKRPDGSIWRVQVDDRLSNRFRVTATIQALPLRQALAMILDQAHLRMALAVEQGEDLPVTYHLIVTPYPTVSITQTGPEEEAPLPPGEKVPLKLTDLRAQSVVLHQAPALLLTCNLSIPATVGVRIRSLTGENNKEGKVPLLGEEADRRRTAAWLENTQEGKVPLLGDLPVIGPLLFRYRTKNNQDTPAALGPEVCQVLEDWPAEESLRVIWDGCDAEGNRVSAGSYLCEIQAATEQQGMVKAMCAVQVQENGEWVVPEPAVTETAQ